MGGLPTLLQLLGSGEATLRARAALVLGAAAQNNEPVQQAAPSPLFLRLLFHHATFFWGAWPSGHTRIKACFHADVESLG